MALFGFGRARPDDDTRRRIEDWARAAGGFEAATLVKVNEIVCADPACPGFETIILVMAPGKKTEARKVAKPMAEVTQADITQALRDEP